MPYFTPLHRGGRQRTFCGAAAACPDRKSVRAKIGIGAKKLRISAPLSTQKSACCISMMDVSCCYFCKVCVQYHRVPFSTIAPRILPMVTGI